MRRILPTHHGTRDTYPPWYVRPSHPSGYTIQPPVHDPTSAPLARSRPYRAKPSTLITDSWWRTTYRRPCYRHPFHCWPR